MTRYRPPGRAADRYAAVAILLHWQIATAIIGNLLRPIRTGVGVVGPIAEWSQ